MYTKISNFKPEIEFTQESISSGILKIKRGRSPNCSSSGSVVDLAILSSLAAAVLLNAFASRFLKPRDPPPEEPEGGPEDPEDEPIGPDSHREADPPPPTLPRLREESFGGILAVEAPPSLLYLNPAGVSRARARGVHPVGRPSPSPLPGALSAPTEVHVSLTTRCAAGCRGCYLPAGPRGGNDAEWDSLVTDLRQMAEQGVLEVALGGGESLERPLLWNAARVVRDLGMVPNLTTSGLGMTPQRARDAASLFGQVNLSVDGLGESYRGVRGWDGSDAALQSLEWLVEAGASPGINTVLTRHNVAGLESLGEALSARGAREWQWLRWKPAGRASTLYEAHRLTPEQAWSLWPRALEMQADRALPIRFDCALLPFLVVHRPSPDLLNLMGVTGCPGGESLWTRDVSGAFSPCSFSPPSSPTPPPLSLESRWRTDETLREWRDRARSPPPPCSTCPWQSACRGGCRVVAAHVTGDPLSPDPECPRVHPHPWRHILESTGATA